MAIKQITPCEAKESLEKNEGYVYLDVRSEEEFEKGRPTDSINIPLKQLNQEFRMLQDNPDFVAVVEANFSKDAKLIVGCASGPRSQMACEMLEGVGYEDLANVVGGYSGARDMVGNLTQEGWVQLGFPTASGEAGEQGYSALQKKSK